MMSKIETLRVIALEDAVTQLKADVASLKAELVASDAAYDLAQPARRRPGRPRKVQESQPQ